MLHRVRSWGSTRGVVRAMIHRRGAGSAMTHGSGVITAVTHRSAAFSVTYRSGTFPVTHRSLASLPRKRSTEDVGVGGPAGVEQREAHEQRKNHCTRRGKWKMVEKKTTTLVAARTEWRLRRTHGLRTHARAHLVCSLESRWADSLGR